MKLVRAALFLTTTLVACACAAPVEWEERMGDSGPFLVATCPHCDAIVDYGRDECDRCEGSYRWVNRPGEED